MEEEEEDERMKGGMMDRRRGRDDKGRVQAKGTGKARGKARAFLITDIPGTSSLSENEDDDDGIWEVPASAYPNPDDLVRQHIGSGSASGSRSALRSTVPQPQLLHLHHHLPPSPPRLLFPSPCTGESIADPPNAEEQAENNNRSTRSRNEFPRI